ncbi:DUF4232 domain-containing protein [Streptomyces sp. MMG1121]|uniref:DUF4232 domain-containing protein n=1 Tax=Streptomyces sp. MMG1121 TaxID=1415544 RepID=UPI0006C3F637|nr:DUF4232 domain-containing protein [Streptomyces sp. MMG1121]KOV67926.1 hypothetical protein ADK64_08510 [Streptomyces sp. MMG1121]
MFHYPNAPRLFRTSPRRGAAAVLTAALVGLTAAGAAWSAPSATSRTSASVRTCTVGDLYLSMGRKEGAAGSLYWPIRFTNTSTTSCTLRGYPGVSVLDTAHHQLGRPATRSGSSYDTVTLTPGHSAPAVVRTTNGPVGGPCLRTGAYLRVYPPASRTAALIPAPWTTCSGVFQVGPVNVEGAI